MGIVLIGSGLVTAALGLWSGYAAARSALAPLVHDGDPTRTAVEAGRHLLARPRIRLFVRRVVVSVGWLVVALYGLFLVSVGWVTR